MLYASKLQLHDQHGQSPIANEHFQEQSKNKILKIFQACKEFVLHYENHEHRAPQFPEAFRPAEMKDRPTHCQRYDTSSSPTQVLAHTFRQKYWCPTILETQTEIKKRRDD